MGPDVLVIGRVDEETLNFAAALMSRFTRPTEGELWAKIWRGSEAEELVEVNSRPNAAVAETIAAG
jgi:hypothetical protein